MFPVHRALTNVSRIEDPPSLKIKVEEALTVLREYQAKEGEEVTQ
jgi:hypothetical protein